MRKKVRASANKRKNKKIMTVTSLETSDESASKGCSEGEGEVVSVAGTGQGKE